MMRPSNDLSTTETTRLRLEVRGAVQGVGFRPFVYRLARELGLAGWVNNSPQGAAVEVEGERGRIDEFLRRLPNEKPRPCVLHSLTPTFLPLAGYISFEVRDSSASGPKTAVILARPGDVLRLSARGFRSQQSAFPLSVHQLHQLRSALSVLSRICPTIDREPR